MSSIPYTERANPGLHDYIFDYLVRPILPVDSVLDIACGSGAWLHRLQKQGVPRLLGLDADTAQFVAPGIPNQQVNLDRYDGHDFGRFQLITCIEIMEHLQNPGKLLQLISLHLEPNGLCILSTPNIHSRNARLRYALKGELGHFDGKSDPTHIYPVYTFNLQKMLSCNKLLIKAVHGFPRAGSTNYSRPIQLLAALASPLMRRTFEGDNIIYCISPQCKSHD